MRYLFYFAVLIHALIHLLGFFKAFNITEVDGITQAVSKPLGVLWALACLVFFLFGWLHYSNHPYSWVAGFLAIAISQLLIFFFWQDAKFGSIPNVLLLVVSVISFATFSFHRMVHMEVSNFIEHIDLSDQEVLREEELNELPEAVQKWITVSGAVGRPKIQIAKLTQEAEMKTDPSQTEWMRATAQQVTRMEDPGFIWKTKVDMNSLLNFYGRDKFIDGKGEMLIKINSLIPVADAKGPKIDEGALQRFLGEMVWFPSLALNPMIQWEAIDSVSARATLRTEDTSGSGIFRFNESGQFIEFKALRYKGGDTDALRKEWVLQVLDYAVFDGIEVPSEMTATWRLDEGDWMWLKLELADLRFNSDALRN